MHFRKSYICSQKLDVHEANVSISQLHRIRDHIVGRIVAILHGNTNHNNQQRRDPSKSSTRKKIHGRIHDLDNVDFISSNVKSSGQEALLYVFEDKEAVIKMIIKCRQIHWPGQLTSGTPPNEESGPLAENTPLT